jgi:hypothetical protein
VWKTDAVMPPLLAHVLLNATAVADAPVASLLAAAIVLADGLLLARETMDEG